MLWDMKTKKTYIGTVCVDTGHLVIADPLFAAEAAAEAYADTDLGELQLTGADAGLNVHEGKFAVLTSTGFGDGFYPVYAHYTEDGRVARITIECIDTRAK